MSLSSAARAASDCDNTRVRASVATSSGLSARRRARSARSVGYIGIQVPCLAPVRVSLYARRCPQGTTIDHPLPYDGQHIRQVWSECNAHTYANYERPLIEESKQSARAVV